MSVTLYALTAELREQISALADVSMSQAEAADTLESLQFEFEVKVRAVVAVSRELDAEAEVVKAEAQRMAARAKQLADRADDLRDYALRSIQAVGYVAPLRFTEFTVGVAKNPASCVIKDPSLVPIEYCEEIPASYVPEKKRILVALKGGQTVYGCELAEPTYRLSVR